VWVTSGYRSGDWGVRRFVNMFTDVWKLLSTG
jgi:hypothetical protein